MLANMTRAVLCLALCGCAASHSADPLACSVDACGEPSPEAAPAAPWECEIPEAGFRNTFCAALGATAEEMSAACARSCRRAGACSWDDHAEPIVYPCAVERADGP